VIDMIVVVIGIAAVAELVLGVALGWAVRGPVGRWCRCGDILRCPTCQPVYPGQRA